MPKSLNPNPTLIDVARAAGVSTASASRALSGREGVTPELHRRIMAAATRLGYRGNWAASALASKRSRLVGLILSGVPDAMSGAILGGAQGMFRERGFACLLAMVAEPAESRTATAALLARGAEAVLYAGVAPEAATTDVLGGQGVPWIAIGEDTGAPGGILLGRDAGGELAARYLLELRHERLAVVGHHAADWAGGVARGLSRSEASAAQAIVSGSDPNTVKLAILELLDRPRRPTALLCSSDADALIALRECTLLGLRIARDISIVGFGDEAFAAHCVPALTTIRNSPGDVGRQAAVNVLSLIEGQPTETYQPAVKLVIRESAGPAP